MAAIHPGPKGTWLSAAAGKTKVMLHVKYAYESHHIHRQPEA
jgi:hypothetical protein